MAYFSTKSKEPKRKPSTWLTFSQRVRNRKGSQVLGLLFTKSKEPKRKPSTWLTFSRRVIVFLQLGVFGLLFHQNTELKVSLLSQQVNTPQESKKVFYVLKFTPKQLLLKLSGLKSIESEIALRRPLFLGCLLSGDKLTPVICKLFKIRANSYFDTNIVLLGVLPSICEALHKYDLFSHFHSWYHDSSLQTYASWKTAVKHKIWEFGENSWNSFILDHPNLSLAQACLATVSPHMFWSISDQYPDLVCCLHVQIRLMGNFGLNWEIPWITNTDGALLFVCKRDTEMLGHFLFDCPDFREHFDVYSRP